MNENPPDAATGSAAGQSRQMPPDTTPTWESELLISGAVVFSMLQMPGVLASLSDYLSPRLGGQWFNIAYFSILYAKVVVFALIATFVTHLTARGLWTAIIGLRSVYPAGVRWEQLRYGPNMLEVARARTTSLSQLIERVDNFASLIFALGALLVLMALTALLLTVATLGLGYLISHFVLADRHDKLILIAMAAIVLVLPLALLVDRWIAPRLPREHWLGRVLRTVFRSADRLPISRLSAPMLLVFTSNIGRRRGMLLLIGMLYALLALAMADSQQHRGKLSIDNYSLLPAGGGARTLQPQHYANQRDGGLRYLTVPFIQSDVVSDPYLKLFVPYVPNTFTTALTRGCPSASVTETADLAAEDARRDALLTCVSRLLQTTLDGALLANLRFDFATDSSSGLRGFIAYLPTATLSSGPHELRLQQFPSLSAELTADDKAAPQTVYRIAFWR